MGEKRLLQTRLPVELVVKLRVIASALDKTLNEILQDLVEDFVAQHSGRLGLRRAGRIGKEDIPVILKAIDQGTAERLRRTKSGKLGLGGEAGKQQKRKEIRRS